MPIHFIHALAHLFIIRSATGVSNPEQTPNLTSLEGMNNVYKANRTSCFFFFHKVCLPGFIKYRKESSYPSSSNIGSFIQI